jgi:hypothetical protein
MIEIQSQNSPNTAETSSVFKCPQGHNLIDADRTKRKRKNGTVYFTPGFNCDICRRTFSSGQSWHCSCSDSGFDKCVGCIVFQLYDVDNDILQLASEDNEEQQARFRRLPHRNTVRLPRGLFRLLTGSLDEEDDDADALALRHRSPFLSQRSTFEGTDDEEIEVNLRED